MLESLFIANGQNGQVIIEKHWRGMVHRSVIDSFFKEYISTGQPEEISPVTSTPQYLMVHILKGGLVFLGVVSSDVSPIVIVEFLHQVVETIACYIKEISENTIKENFVIIYQLLEEMVDYGFPLMTDVGTLKNFVAPPNILNKVISQVTGVSRTHDGMLTGGFSTVPWRKTGLKYTNNEIYFDIVEEIDTIIENDGSVVTSELNGSILSQSRLSVNSGRFEFSLVPHFVQGIPLENVILRLNVAKGVSNVVGSCNLGLFTSDYHTKQMVWKLNKLSPKDRCPVLTGTYSSNGMVKLSAAIDITFQVTMCAISGLKVDSLKVLNENYKPYKGVRSVTRAGRFQIRL